MSRRWEVAERFRPSAKRMSAAVVTLKGPIEGPVNGARTTLGDRLAPPHCQHVGATGAPHSHAQVEHVLRQAPPRPPTRYRCSARARGAQHHGSWRQL
jgi:hypothetical protein